MPAALAEKKIAERRAGMRPSKAESALPSKAAPALATTAGMPAFLQRKGNHRDTSHATAIDSSDFKEMLAAEGLHESIQAKLVLGAPDDPLEHEADRVAEAASKKDQVQRRDVEPPHRKSVEMAGAPGGDAGLPLADPVRRRIEPVLDTDLGNVRVHTGEEATRTAQALDARAFTNKNHIWLGANESPDNTQLIGHESTHVVQQSGGAGLGNTPDGAPSFQRQQVDSSSTSAAPPAFAATPGMSLSGDAALSANPEPLSSQMDEEPSAALPQESENGSDGGEGDADPESGGAEGDAPGEVAEGTQAAAVGGGESGGDAGGGAVSTEGEIGSAPITPLVPETGAGALETGDLVLIDVELAEHQRWAGALGRVGAASSLHRAEFVAEAVGSGFISGAASGLAMGLGIGLVSRAVPAIGPVIGGAMALHGLVSRDWAETGATIGRFGEGSSTYETLANTIASVAAVIDVVSQVLTVINGIVGVVQIAAAVIAGGAVVAAFFTFGATLGIAAVAADVVAVCQEISMGINAVTMVLDTVNAAILQPSVTLFRALHAYTTQADPREVEAQGSGISTAAAASGAALGAWAGGRAANMGGGARPSEDLPPSQRLPHETPPPAAGDGPTVHFQETPTSAAHAEGAPLPVAHAEAAPPPVAHVEGAPPPAAHTEPAATPTASTAPESIPTPAASRAAEPMAMPPSAPELVTPPHAGEPTPTAPAAPETPGTGLRIESVGEPTGDLGRMTNADIDGFLSGIDSGGARSDTFFELPAGRDIPNPNPHRAPGDPAMVPETGLQRVDIRTSADPAKIAYHDNMRFEGVTRARIAEHGTIAPGERGTTRGRPGVSHTERSILPDDPARVAISDPVPVRGPASPRAGEPFPVEVRTHSSNPDPALAARAPHAHSLFNPTTQVNIKGRPKAQGGDVYLLPDGRWVPLGDPGIGPGHYPVGGRDRGPLGLGEIPGIPGGVPTPVGGGGGGAPPPLAGSPSTSTDGGPQARAAGGEPGIPQRVLVVGAERPAEFEYATQMAGLGNDVTVVNPQATPESAAFAAQGGNFVEAGIETLPQRPGYNVVSEDFPVPIRRMFPQARDMATERISRLEPGGRWVVTTESTEFVQMLELVGGMQGARVTSHEVPRFHEATPDSPRHVVDQRRFIVTVDRSTAPATPPSSESAPPATPPLATFPSTTSPTGTLATAPSPSTSTAPQDATSSSMSTLPAAAGAARTAVAGQTPGGPQPGTESPTWGTRAHQVGELFLPQVFGGGGEAPTYAQQQAAHRARFTEDNQPAEGVERVNPQYPPPPATPAQITAIQNEIMNLLAVRASAEQEAENQSGRADRCEENQGPIQQTVEDTTAGISAVQAHDEAITRREAVNQEQQQRQQESQGLVAGYPSRAAGLLALTVPLDAWAGFTSLASHLPGEAGDSMLRMNQEARQMQDSFVQMGAEMLGVDSAGPARQEELQGDQGRLEATGELAQTSDQQLNTASDGAAGLQEANEAALAEATERRDAATERAQECSDAATQREEQADSLAEQLSTWASAHAQARQQAVAATVQRLESEGRTVVRSSEQ